MANSRHLKRHSMPKSWSLQRKVITFTTRANPGSYKRDYIIPVVSVFRDLLNLTKTLREVKYVLTNKEVLINGKKISSYRAPLGLFDVFEIKEISLKKILVFDEFGKFKLIDVKDDLLYLKISSKKLLSGKKFQLNMENGFNLLVDEKMFNSVKVNETVLYDFIKKKIISVISLKEGNYVYVIDGNYKGKLAKVIDFTNYNGLSRDLVSIEFEGSTHSTAKDYCFPVANKIEDLKRFN